MKTLKLFLLPVLESLEFGRQVIHYALIFVSAFFRQRASLGCEFVILNHSRRQVVHFAVTAHPTTAWVIQQLREAMPFGQQPTYLFRDNDGI